MTRQKDVSGPASEGSGAFVIGMFGNHNLLWDL